MIITTPKMLAQKELQQQNRYAINLKSYMLESLLFRQFSGLYISLQTLSKSTIKRKLTT